MTALQAGSSPPGSAIKAARADASPLTITMTVSPEMLGEIEQLGRDSGQPLELVFEQAIALYRAALTAHIEGKHVGLAASSDALDVEFTGFPGD